MSMSTDLQSLVKVGAITFAGAFLSALTLTGIPTTLAEVKAVLAPALFAAVAAEVVYLRKLLTAAQAPTTTTLLSTVEETKVMTNRDVK